MSHGGGMSHSGGMSHGGISHGGISYGSGVRVVSPGGAYRPGYYPNSNVRVIVGGYPFVGGYFSPYSYGGYSGYGGGYGGGLYGSASGFGSYFLPNLPDDANAAPTPPVAPPASGTAQIQVLLPDADGEVWFDGRKTRQLGNTRLFATPQLEPGKTYSYQISAAWHQNGKLVGDERTIEVAPGRTVVVDFSRPAEMKKE
jgi:uncharacterized protein (TIGR03000 family)